MKIVVLIILALSCISAQYLDPNHNLKFVFEIVRHGARAPTQPDALRFGTTVGPGELTPNGMRQRYFLGRYNYERYH